MGVITYIVPSEEVGANYYLRVEIGRLDDFSTNDHIQFYLEKIAEQNYACIGVPLGRCMVKRFTLIGDAEMEHNPKGAALLVTDVLTGHHYLQIHAKNGLMHNHDGAGVIYDDGESRHEWGYIDGEAVWDQDLASMLQL